MEQQTVEVTAMNLKLAECGCDFMTAWWSVQYWTEQLDYSCHLWCWAVYIWHKFRVTICLVNQKRSRKYWEF